MLRPADPDTRLAMGALIPIPEPLAGECASMSGSSTSSICASMASCSLRSTRPSKEAGVLKDWEEIRYNESGA